MTPGRPDGDCGSIATAEAERPEPHGKSDEGDTSAHDADEGLSVSVVNESAGGYCGHASKDND